MFLIIVSVFLIRAKVMIFMGNNARKRRRLMVDPRMWDVAKDH